jgi:uncharacterized protein YfdQ (DUF2303 family)
MTTPDEPRTAVDAAAALAARPVVTPVEAPGIQVVETALPPGWSVQTSTHDFEKRHGQPNRPKGNVNVYDGPAFELAVNRLYIEGPDPVPVYADEEKLALVAILNDDTAAVGAGWRDHRVELRLRRRPEWEHWLSLDGKLVDQHTFAQHIEDGLAEIVNPAAADMLDLAQTISGATKGSFKGGARLGNGARAFGFEEEVSATAGAAGNLHIPETFTLQVRPFFGADPWEMVARFRYQLRSGELTLGYRLVRPGDIERGAFTAVAEAVTESLSADMIAGQAPTSRG